MAQDPLAAEAGEEPEMDDSDCCICYGKAKKRTTVLTVPCAHRFHRHCLATWVAKEKWCPVCKTDLEGYFGKNKTMEVMLNTSVQNLLKWCYYCGEPGKDLNRYVTAICTSTGKVPRTGKVIHRFHFFIDIMALICANLVTITRSAWQNKLLVSTFELRITQRLQWR
jgi:hypothetical protein